MLRPFRTGHFIFRHLPIGSSSWPKAGVKVAMASSGSSGTAREHSNRLVHERSPYLLQHAHNPVDWYPWGEEAFVKAQREDKPIFLSVGYSTCHWCHVMEVESFENEEVAKLLNDFFVSIKVDREERPDVDKVYMTFVQASQGGGGWPMSVFLTPELKPIVGGTYFPPNDAFGRPGFKSVLRQVKRIWDAKKDVIRVTGDHVVQQLAEAAAISSPTQNVEKTFAEQALDFCANQLAESFDKKLGGFGGPPKFPRPVATNAMLWQYKRLKRLRNEKSAAKALESALFTLNCMGRGGIHDHIGGGFHRYSVDEYWHVPHFEKMLYDQAQLVNIYLDAFIIGQDVRHAYVVRDILDYLKRDMTHDKGGIFSAEDADSAENEAAARKKEGCFYVWTKQEIENVLGHEYAPIFAAHYYVKEGGNCNLSRMSDPHKEFIGKNVLIERQDLSETAEKFKRSTEEMSDLLGKCRKILFDHRNKRPRPHRDDKIIVAWNALAISAFARASRILNWEPKQSRHHFPDTGCEPDEYLVIAERIAIFIRDHLFDASIMRLQRCFLDGPSKAPGFLDDYAFLVAALIDLYEIGGSTKWLSWAIELQKIQDELFLDKAGGGYYGTPEGDASILFRVKEDYDGAEPSGNSIAAFNLIRLSSFVSGEKSKAYLQQAEHLLAIFENRVREVAVALPMMCCAFDLFSVPSKCQVVIAGSKKSHASNALLTAVFSSYNPMMSVIQVDVLDEEDKEFWQAYNPAVFSMAEKHATGDPVAYVCQNFTCQAPVNDPASLERLLKEH